MKKIIALVLMLGVSSIFAETVVFGSDNDVLGGFTQSTEQDTYETWTTSAGSVQYNNSAAGTFNSSLLKAYTLDRSIGSQVMMSGSVTLTDGYADDNNRVGMYLFGDSATVPNEDEIGAIGFIFNSDDTSAGGVGNNAQDNITLRVGIDSPNLEDSVLRNQSGTPYSQNLFGTTISFGVVLDFVDAGDGSTNINIQAYLTEADGTSTLTTTSVAATNYTGDYFGFVTRARARNYDELNPENPANTPENRALPWIMDYESFKVIPEPATVGMFGIFGAALLLIRRRLARR